MSWSGSRVSGSVRAWLCAQHRRGHLQGLLGERWSLDLEHREYTLMLPSLSSHTLISKGRREFYLPKPLCAQITVGSVSVSLMPVDLPGAVCIKACAGDIFIRHVSQS